jgi:hypothetical protein
MAVSPNGAHSHQNNLPDCLKITFNTPIRFSTAVYTGKSKAGTAKRSSACPTTDYIIMYLKENQIKKPI